MRAAPAVCLAIAIAQIAPALARAEAPAVTPPRALSPEKNEARADELFKDGVRAFDAGHVVEACDAFTESLRLGPKLGTLLNLALCHEHQGRTATAWSEYAHSAAWATQLGQKDRREFANSHAILLEGRLARVELQLPPARELSQVEVDGEPLPSSRWFLPLFLDPGEHAIAVSGKGKTPRVMAFVVPEGSAAQTVRVPALDALPKEAATPLPRPPPPLPDPSNARHNAGLVVGGVGIVGLAVGTIFGLRTLGQRDDIGAHCTGNACDARGIELRDSARASATVSNVAFAVGLVGVGVSAWLLLTSPAQPAHRMAQLTW